MLSSQPDHIQSETMSQIRMDQKAWQLLMDHLHFLASAFDMLMLVQAGDGEIFMLNLPFVLNAWGL